MAVENAFRGVRFEKTREGDLLITHDYPDEAIDRHADLSDWFEWHLANGWSWVEPIEVEALTDAPILTDDVERDGTGKITRLGRVFVHTRYQLEDAAEELALRKRVVFKGFNPELRPCMPLASAEVE